MKVFVALILAIGSVSGLGSGPYLPSGWRPEGPAFYLPGEVQKPQDNPLKEILLESEASASDVLREYGPPKVQEVFVNAVQGLPDVATERTFLVVETLVQDVGEVSEQKSEVVQEATTEATIAETATEIVQRLADIQLQDDITSALYETQAKEEIQATTASVDIKENEATEEIQGRAVGGDVQAIVSEVNEDIQATSSSVEVKEEAQIVASLELEQIAEVEEKVEQVKNVAETLINLENEIKAELVAAVENSAELKINQDSGSTEGVQGLLEYGPPGFREYGPPKGDELLRSAVVQESDVSVESNEARRRRFSPKFRATKGKGRQ